MITIIPEDELQQGTEEWLDFRSTRISGTDAYSLLKGKSIPDILYSKQHNSFTGNFYTERGHALEEVAKDIYSEARRKVTNAGAIINDKYPNAMYSPDGLIDERGLVECKAFNSERHFKNYQKIEPQIMAQIQFGLFLSERKYCDLILFNPDLDDPKDMMLIRRVKPDKWIFLQFKHLLTGDSFLTKIEV